MVFNDNEPHERIRAVAGDKAEDYVYSSAVDYAGQKGLVDDVVVFRMFGILTITNLTKGFVR